MKLFKQVLLSLIIISLFITPVAQANDTMLGKDGIMSSIEGYGTSDDYEKQKNSQFTLKSSFDLNYSTNSLKYISKCSSSIKDMGKGIVYITASTKSITTVDHIKVKVYLEKWNGSSWTAVSNWTKSKKASDTVTFTKSVYIKKNEKYRVKALHSVTHNGNDESDITITSYITSK